MTEYFYSMIVSLNSDFVIERFIFRCIITRRVIRFKFFGYVQDKLREKS